MGVVTATVDLERAAVLGIHACRKGDLENGLRCLGGVAEMMRDSVEVPSVFYSYLGYALAECEGRLKEGLSLCEHAVRIGFLEPENYTNLARVYVLCGNRSRASRAVMRGLKMAPRNEELRLLHEDLGIRHRPVLPFLARGNPLNRTLGRLRHSWRDR